MKTAFVIALSFTTSLLAAQTPRLEFRAPLLYPEGAAYDSVGKVFYVSSVKMGTIGKVTEDGTYTEVLKDSLLKSSYGMRLDAGGKRLHVCIADGNYSKYSKPSTFQKMSRLITIDLASGKKVRDVNLAALMPGKHFSNDLALDAKGNVYVTDSYAPLIYKVTPEGRASIFAKHDLFKSPDVGLNGIVYHPDGYLLVAHTTNGILLKVPIASPAQVSVVKLPALFPGADGLLWAGPNDLVLIQNGGVDKAFRITSATAWASAEITSATAVEDRFRYPTNAIRKDNQVWLLNAKLDENEDRRKKPSETFSFQVASFRPVK